MIVKGKQLWTRELLDEFLGTSGYWKYHSLSKQGTNDTAVLFGSSRHQLKLKEFQSMENDVCHTVVFYNVATVVASCKTLHWMQMADGSNVNLGTLENFQTFFLSEFVFFHRIFF